MKFYAKAMSVLVKLEFRQKIKCQTSLKRGKTRGKTACREEGISSRKGVDRTCGNEYDIPRYQIIGTSFHIVRNISFAKDQNFMKIVVMKVNRI